MENFSDDPFFENFDENAYDYFKEYSRYIQNKRLYR